MTVCMFLFGLVFFGQINIFSAVQAMLHCTFPTCDLPPPSCQAVTDSFGCPTCHYICQYGSFICPQIWCQNDCIEGYALDKRGCQSCNCKYSSQALPPPPPPQGGCHTWMQCPQGMCSNGCDCQPHCGGPGPMQRMKIEFEEPNEIG